jgi:NAD(P)-dependent dehydrogenase (short-subunit alcohol dehydrogenase family)
LPAAGDAAHLPSHLPSLGNSSRVLVWGAGGAIGAALISHLSDDPRIAHIYAIGRRPFAGAATNLTAFTADFGDEAAIADVAAQCAADGQPLDAVIVATGVLHDTAAGIAPEKTWRSLSADQLQHIFTVNTIGPALIGKHFLPLLARNKRAIFAALSARVGSISDNRMGGWHAYRASKAALNMMLKNFAIELARRNPEAICAGLHPGTVNSDLSAPFQSNVPAQGLFTADFSAAQLLAVLDRLGPQDSGHLFAWDGARIEP